MKSLCIARINKDLKEIDKSPLEGIGIISLDNNPMKYIVNIKIMIGIYEGYCLQLLLTFSDNYPYRPPKILIYPGQLLNNTYHHHIFKDNLLDEKGRNFYKFCFDLLDNDFLSTSSEKTGWNPSYTISSFLLQVQTFLSQPDMPESHLPNEDKIKELMKSMEEFENYFKIKNNNEEIIIKHTWKNPYPEMYIKKEEDKNLGKEIDKENERINKIKENLTCFISRLNYIDNKNILLGYPIKKNKDGSLIPISQILSYDCFIEEYYKIRENNENNNNDIFRNNFFDFIDEINLIINNRFNFNNNFERNFFRFHDMNELIINMNRDREISFKSANNELYQAWLPIYIDENHFQNNMMTILNYFSILKYGDIGIKKYDFHPQYIFEIMPNILASMIRKMIQDNISSSFLKCFFQYTLLYKKLENKYEGIFPKYQKFYLERNIYKIIKRKGDINVINEIFELFILFFFSDKNISSNLKEKLNNYIGKLKKYVYLKLLQCVECFNFDFPGLFIKHLKIKNLFDKIVDIIFIDTYELLLTEDNLILCEILRNKLIKEMETNFKGLYIKISETARQKINKIIIDELNFSIHFINKSFFYHKNRENHLSINNLLFKFFKLFESLKEKILSDDCLSNLENNFGIFFESENFIDDLNKKKKDINNIKSISESKFFKTIKEILFLIFEYRYDCISRFSFYLQNYYLKFINYDSYPFVNIIKSDGGKDLTILISKKINRIIKKEKEIGRKKNKIFELKKPKENYKDKIKKDRKIIKLSYAKNSNKVHKKYINKKVIKLLLK